MIEKSQMFTVEQVQTVLYVISTLILTNIGAILGWVFSEIRKIRKMRKDLDLNWQFLKGMNERILKLETDKQQTQGVKNEIISSTLQK